MSLFHDIQYTNLISPYLERFRRKSDYIYNCRCPYCGDSQKKKSKARGYIYRKKDGLFFYCHNCGMSVSIGTLIKFLNKSLYDQYVMERYVTGETGHKAHKEPNFESVKPKKMIRLKLHLPNIDELGSEHVAKNYLIERKIPEEYLHLFYYAEDFQEWAVKITEGKYKEKYRTESTDPRIVIPFLDQKRNLIAVQARSLLPSKLRYVTIKFVEDSEKIFGLERWDSGKVTYVLEGPFDSLFLPNALAMAGSSVDVSSFFHIKREAVFVFDNERRNKEIVRLMQGKIDAGFSICIWPESNPEKDINDMIMSGRTKEEVLNEIEDHTYHGLSATLELSNWKRC